MFNVTVVNIKRIVKIFGIYNINVWNYIFHL